MERPVIAGVFKGLQQREALEPVLIRWAPDAEARPMCNAKPDNTGHPGSGRPHGREQHSMHGGGSRGTDDYEAFLDARAEMVVADMIALCNGAEPTT